MDPMLRYLFILLASPVFAFLVHLALVRLCSLLKLHFNPLLVAGFSVLAGLFLMSFVWWRWALSSIWEPSERLWAYVYGFIVYNKLAFCYFQLFAITETALRIRILRELRSEGKTRRSDLHHRYGAADMLSVRLMRLEQWGSLKSSNHRYLLSGCFLYAVAKVIDWWAGVLGFKKERVVG